MELRRGRATWHYWQEGELGTEKENFWECKMYTLWLSAMLLSLSLLLNFPFADELSILRGSHGWKQLSPNPVQISTILEVSPLDIPVDLAGSSPICESVIHLSGQKTALQRVWTNYPQHDIVSYLCAFSSYTDSPKWLLWSCRLLRVVFY